MNREKNGKQNRKKLVFIAFFVLFTTAPTFFTAKLGFSAVEEVKSQGQEAEKDNSAAIEAMRQVQRWASHSKTTNYSFEMTVKTGQKTGKITYYLKEPDMVAMKSELVGIPDFKPFLPNEPGMFFFTMNWFAAIETNFDIEFGGYENVNGQDSVVVKLTVKKAEPGGDCAQKKEAGKAAAKDCAAIDPDGAARLKKLKDTTLYIGKESGDLTRIVRGGTTINLSYKEQEMSRILTKGNIEETKNGQKQVYSIEFGGYRINEGIGEDIFKKYGVH
jgi:hypothetical protein